MQPSLCGQLELGTTCAMFVCWYRISAAPQRFGGHLAHRIVVLHEQKCLRAAVADVVMPGDSGPKLAARLLQQNPELRVLYILGYTDDAAAIQGHFWGGVPLLQKPFTPTQLAERVRFALDASPSRA